jgi:hypothetical protein
MHTIPIISTQITNQAAEHLATQPNMSDNSRSIDIRHHEIKQDYVEGGMRIGEVSSKGNTADILTKTLQPPQHAKHCTHLHILQPTMTSHVITIHNHSVFTFKSPQTTTTTRKKEAQTRTRLPHASPCPIRTQKRTQPI